MRIRKRAVGLVFHPALSKITFCPGSAIVLGMESDPYIYFLRYIGSNNVYKVFTVSYLEDQCRAALLFFACADVRSPRKDRARPQMVQTIHSPISLPCLSCYPAMIYNDIDGNTILHK